MCFTYKNLFSSLSTPLKRFRVAFLLCVKKTFFILVVCCMCLLLLVCFALFCEGLQASSQVLSSSPLTQVKGSLTS